MILRKSLGMTKKQIPFYYSFVQTFKLYILNLKRYLVSLGLLGNKIGMTQIFDKKGDVIAVTIIKAGPCYITQLKSYENCGYNSIQIGYLEVSKKKVTKPNLGHFDKSNLCPFRYLKEYKISAKNGPEEISTSDVFENYKIGQKLDVDMFQIGQQVTVSGVTIGKGNTGNIKRNNFSRGPMGHGSKHHRLQGSIGSGTTPGRVYPGKKMPGRVGMEQRTISNLTIVDIDKKENLLVIKGCIPGKPGNFVNIKI